MINYKERLTTDRELNSYSDIDISVESDRGRIFSSAAFRRLQKRTQVFALELNASIRSRLTHSLEVAQNARYIARTILDELKKNDLKTFDNKQIASWKALTIIATIATSIVSFTYTIYQHFLK